MMKSLNAQTIFTVGPFADVSDRLLDFAPNMYFSYLVEENIKQQQELKKEYEEALLNNDETLAETKKSELDVIEGVYRLSLAVLEVPGTLLS
jgi:hypothetical protein